MKPYVNPDKFHSVMQAPTNRFRTEIWETIYTFLSVPRPEKLIYSLQHIPFKKSSSIFRQMKTYIYTN